MASWLPLCSTITWCRTWQEGEAQKCLWTKRRKCKCIGFVAKQFELIGKHLQPPCLKFWNFIYSILFISPGCEYIDSWTRSQKNWVEWGQKRKSGNWCQTHMFKSQLSFYWLHHFWYSVDSLHVFLSPSEKSDIDTHFMGLFWYLNGITHVIWRHKGMKQHVCLGN